MVLVIALFISRVGRGLTLQTRKALVEDSIVGKGRTWQDVALYSPEISALFKRDNTGPESFVYPGMIPWPCVFLC